MKVLFLDVDGVLNTFTAGGLYALTRSKLRLLEQIVKDTGCEIVLSSTWRKDQYAFRKLVKKLAYRDLNIAGTTPVLWNVPRGEEIDAWLKEHSETTRYAILDDNSDMLDHQLRNFFQTDGDYGLTRTIAYRVIHHLKD